MKHIYDLDSVLKLLQFYVNQAGSKAAYAKAKNMSPQYLNDVLQGRRAPGEKILDALGMYKETRYIFPDSADELNRKIHGARG